MEWKKTDMAEALRHAKPRTIDESWIATGLCPGNSSPPAEAACEVVGFTDGTAIGCESDWEDDWSEVTPGSSLIPTWWIYT